MITQFPFVSLTSVSPTSTTTQPSAWLRTDGKEERRRIFAVVRDGDAPENENDNDKDNDKDNEGRRLGEKALRFKRI